MDSFLTSQQISQAPPFPVSWQILVFISLIAIVFLTVKYGHSRRYQIFFQLLQWGMLLIINAWYLLMAISWRYSLPLFHCRLAMWALLLLPDQTKCKQYFALMGLAGTILTFAYPVMDHYAFPHITALNFILGHILLFANSLIYLYRFYHAQLLSIYQIGTYTLLINAILIFVNQLTGGNYGLLKDTPFIADSSIWFRYLWVSAGLVVSMLLMNGLFGYVQIRFKNKGLSIT